jgi:hypothetical protein
MRSGEITAEVARQEAESAMAIAEPPRRGRHLRLTDVTIVTDNSFPFVRMVFETRRGKSYEWHWLIPQDEEDLARWGTLLFACLLEDLDTCVFPPRGHNRPVISLY